MHLGALQLPLRARTKDGSRDGRRVAAEADRASGAHRCHQQRAYLLLQLVLTRARSGQPVGRRIDRLLLEHAVGDRALAEVVEELLDPRAYHASAHI
eukprot:scaffold123273_cov29-Tisochrysis_lutea.AAC.3